MSKKIVTINDNEYSQILQQAVAEIRLARTTVARQVNSIVNSAYWSIGKLLYEKNLEGGYGSGVVKRLSVDLKAEFPDMGLSPRNLWYMKRYYELYYQADIKVQRNVALLPWGHNILLIDKELSLEKVLFYSQEAVQKGWKKELLLNAIKMDTYTICQQQIKSNNFNAALPEAQANYANEVFRLEYNIKEYFVDMLFFHRGLRSLVAVELKIGAFQAEYVGKMNFYLSLLDRLEKGENENSSIGIILCADKDRLDMEIALQDVNKPIGVAEYQLLLPKEELQTLLIQEINSIEAENTLEKE